MPGAREIVLAVPTGGDDRAAILAMLAELRVLLTEVGTRSEVVALAGPTALLRVFPDWDATHPLDRPLLVIRRGVRRLLTPEVPLRLYRTWWR